ncbi:hypothetical protein L208DRAFT_1401663 [Tricholoma matsutake]|nr:hypothetical protein L208DRAFT_1401663 [Tricholoma matsutake 945]
MPKIKCFDIFRDNFKVPWSELDGFWKKFRSDPPHPVRTGPSIWPTLAPTFVRTSTKLGSGLLAANVQNLSGLGPSLGRDNPGSC